MFSLYAQQQQQKEEEDQQQNDATAHLPDTMTAVVDYNMRTTGRQKLLVTAKKLNPNVDGISHSTQLINHPERVGVFGRSNSGKTKLLVDGGIAARIINQCDRVIFSSFTGKQTGLLEYVMQSGKLAEEDNYKTFDAQTLEIIIDDIMQMAEEEEELPKEERTKTVIIVDDQGSEKAINHGQKGALVKLITTSRHLDVSSILLLQGIVMAGTGVRANLDHVFFFKSHVASERETFASEFNDIGSKRLMMAWYETVCRDFNHRFMYLHFHVEKGCFCRYYLTGLYRLHTERLKS